ncbi:MAG: hypothetical protein Q9M91_05595 [Candidatus Dojkabacteria bacterium]|nr:hypothetical protein [Candidatus Dojkabacteria bacterium]MDQ7021277.1 hypothetical protein [Candidatus Dojkabacteria bacterium]
MSNTDKIQTDAAAPFSEFTNPLNHTSNAKAPKNQSKINLYDIALDQLEAVGQRILDEMDEVYLYYVSLLEGELEDFWHLDVPVCSNDNSLQVIFEDDGSTNILNTQKETALECYGDDSIENPIRLYDQAKYVSQFLPVIYGLLEKGMCHNDKIYVSIEVPFSFEVSCQKHGDGKRDGQRGDHIVMAEGVFIIEKGEAPLLTQVRINLDDFDEDTVRPTLSQSFRLGNEIEVEWVNRIYKASRYLARMANYREDEEYDGIFDKYSYIEFLLLKITEKIDTSEKTGIIRHKEQ